MPNKRKPDELKKLSGTFRKCDAVHPGVDYDPISESVPPPEWMGEHAATCWKKRLPTLQSKRIFTEVDFEAFEILCVIYGDIRETVETGEKLNAGLVTQLRMYMIEFGMTPSSRAKVAPAGKNPDEPKNPLKHLM